MKFDWAIEALERVGIDSRLSGSELQICCPSCGDSKYHLYINLERGLYICFRCSEAGRALTLLKKLGVQMPGTGSVRLYKPRKISPPPDPGWPKHRNLKEGDRALKYLRKRGITDRDIKTWMLRLGENPLQDYILWPILDMNYELKGVHCRRFMFDGPRGLMYPTGIGRSVLGLHLANLDPEFIVIVEGPYDAAHVTRELYADGFVGMSLMGHNITPSQCMELGILRKPLKILLDSDAPGEARDVAETLARWAPSVELCSLSEGDPDEHYADVLREVLRKSTRIK